MIFPKIKESIKNSSFFKNYDHAPDEFYLTYKKIKNDYIKSKNEIKNNLKKELVNFINSFLVYNVDDKYLKDYVLDLIQEFGFDDINELIQNTNGNIITKINEFNSIKLLLNNDNIDETFIYDHCTPEYYIKNKNNLYKSKLINNRMITFFNNTRNYDDLIKSKMNIDNILKYKYLKWADNLDELFICAIKNKNIKCAKTLLKLGSDIHTNNEFALEWSCCHGHIEIVKFLVENGANIHVNNDRVFRLSIENGHLEIVKFLVEKGAGIHIYDDYALEWYSTINNIDMVKFLIEKGADIHAKDNRALKMSSFNGRIDVVKFLVEKGADIRAENDFAFRYSCINDHIDVVKFLIEKGADIHAGDDYALKWSCKRGHIEVVKYLIEKGSNIHAGNDRALIWASENNHIEIVKYLVEKGANIRTEDDYALRLASEKNHVEIVKFLISSDLIYFSKKNLARNCVKTYKLVEFYKNFHIK